MAFQPKTNYAPRLTLEALRGHPRARNGVFCDPEEGYPLWERVVVALATGAAPTLAQYMLYKFDPSVRDDESDAPDASATEHDE